MKSKHILQIITFCCLIFCPIGAKSSQVEKISEAQAIEFAQTQGQYLLSLFVEPDIEIKYKKLDEAFNKYVDLDYISRFVIGKYWRDMSKEQQVQYQDLFRRYATSVYKGFPLQFDGELSYKILSSRADAKAMLVTANVLYAPLSGEPISALVEFRMHKKNGVIMITDIKIAESSLILSYRNRFYNMVRDADDDMAWFLEDFEVLTISAEKQYSLKEES